MIVRIPIRVRNATWSAALFSVVMHAIVLMGLVGLGMRPRTAPMKLPQPDLSVMTAEVLLLAEPEAPEKVVSATPNSSRAVPAYSRQATFDTHPKEVAAHDVRADSGPVEPPVAATQPVGGKADERQTESLPTSVSVAAAVPQLDRQTTQSARPDYAFNPQPDYPMLLREHGIGGVVWLRVWVDSEGRPAEIKLAKGSGYRLLDDAALRAVRLWRFIPAQNGTQRLASWVEFPIRFTLDS